MEFGLDDLVVLDPPLSCVVYVSKIAPSARSNLHQTVRSILAQSQINNMRDNITGVLTFNNTFFVQALEGDAVKVEQAFSRISKDIRHTLPTLIYSEAIPQRSFAAWSMCARQLSRLDNDILDSLERHGGFPPGRGSGAATLKRLTAIGAMHSAEFDKQQLGVVYL